MFNTQQLGRSENKKILCTIEIYSLKVDILETFAVMRGEIGHLNFFFAPPFVRQGVDSTLIVCSYTQM